MGDNGIRCLVKVFVGIRLSLLLIQPSPLRNYKEMNALEMERATQISNVEYLPSALPDIHEEVSIRHEGNRSKAPTIQETTVLLHYFEIGDYVVVRWNAK